MTAIIVFADGIHNGFMIDNVRHENIGVSAATKFCMVVVQESSAELPIQRVTFTEINSGAVHSEGVWPFCSNGDYDVIPAGTDEKGLNFKNQDVHKAPNYVTLAQGNYNYHVQVIHSDGSIVDHSVMIHVGADNFVANPAVEPPPEETPGDSEEPESDVPPRRQPFVLPILVWITRDEYVSGVPEENADEFIVRFNALKDEFLRVGIDDAEEAGDDSDVPAA